MGNENSTPFLTPSVGIDNSTSNNPLVIAPGTNTGTYAQQQQHQTWDQPGNLWRVNDNNIFGRNLDSDYCHIMRRT